VLLPLLLPPMLPLLLLLLLLLCRHNIQTLGYEPWHVGFKQSWYTDNNFKDGAVW
jgi:hypothetical protein